MSLIPYPLLRAVLFRMDAEAAHDFTLNWLARTQHTPLAWAYSQPQVSDPVTVAGLRFPNRIGLAAGLDKNARCIDAWAAMGFGFVEVGTVTPMPQPGNPKPRMFRLPPAQALINRFGFNNGGLEAFVANVRATRCLDQTTRPLIGLNIGKNAVTPMEDATSDYLKGLAGVYAHADYVTINISSPNTKNLRQIQNDDTLDALLSSLEASRIALAKRHGKDIPLFVKIAPDLDDAQIQAIAQVLRRYGCDARGQANQRWGLIATNTTLARAAVANLPHGQEAGGLSGAPLTDTSTAVVAAMRRALGPDFPIIGVGGVMSAADALAKRAAGADLVQIYSGLIYQGPPLVLHAARAMAAATRLSAAE
jgi:dihydroorotate dehydrogenase